MGRGKRLSWLVTAALGLATLACADDRQPRTAPDAERPATPAPRAATLTIPVGTTFQIRTHTVLSTERNRPGDLFTASLAGPLVDAAGTVIVPADALVRGRVTAVATPDGFAQPAIMQLAFEAISFAGQSYPLQATIEQVIDHTGTATLRAGAIGAAAGTAIALDVVDAEAMLPRGTELLVRVNDPIPITRRVAG